MFAEDGAWQMSEWAVVGVSVLIAFVVGRAVLIHSLLQVTSVGE